MTMQMNIWDYVSTYNTQDPERLAEMDAAQLERFDNETYDGLGAGPDLEKLLNQVLDIQDRMAKGRVMIDAVQAKLDSFQENRVSYQVFMAHVERIKKLKAHWWKLQRECKALVGENKAVWAMYFNLEKEELNEYFTFGLDDEEETTSGDSRHAPSDEVYRDSHIEEMAEYEKDFNENPYLSRDWWDEWSFNQRENERAELASLEAYAGF